MKSIKEHKGFYCIRPFTEIQITSYHMTMCCCESWLPDFNAGDIEEFTLKEVWNSEKMQDLRQSVLDGTYSLCSKENCPYLKSENFKIYSKDELKAVVDAEDCGTELESSLWHVRQFAPWIRRILDSKVFMDIPPAVYNLSYDETCNLKCPSCRSESIVYANGEELDRRHKIHKNIFDDIEKYGYENARRFSVTGSGDPFISRIYQDLLYNFDGRKYPLLKFFILTNGLLLTPEVWEKMSRIHSNIESIFISVDAATSETYEKIRVNGKYDRLLENVEFLGKKRKENKLENLTFAFIVQKNNYKEMADIIEVAKRHNVDQIAYSSLDDWESWGKEDYFKHAVCSPDHPEYSEFLGILKNPVFDDPIVNLGNITGHRIRALNQDPNIPLGNQI